MKTILMIICLSLISGKVVSQTKEIVNPKGKWFFGVEMGTNKIDSSPQQGESKTAFQGGFLAEYYFAKHWSLSGKIKYFETGVSFFQSSSKDVFCIICNDLYSGTFEGAVIAIPFSLKWEFRVYKNLGANLKMGYALNIETKSTYSNYSSNLSTDYPKQYGRLTPGAGLNYFINKKTALYIDVESFSGSDKGHIVNVFGKTDYSIKNVLTSFGIKYSFK